jgi:hypothetical protein
MPHCLDLNQFNPPDTFRSLFGIYIPMRKSPPLPPTSTNLYSSSTEPSSNKFWMVFIDLPIFFLSIVAVFSPNPSNVSPIASTLVALFVFLPSLSASLLSYNQLRRPLFTPPCWLMFFLSSVPTLTSLKRLFMLVLIIASVRTGIALTPVLIVATLEDLHKSFASLQSQLDKHTRLARQAQDSFLPLAVIAPPLLLTLPTQERLLIMHSPWRMTIRIIPVLLASVRPSTPTSPMPLLFPAAIFFLLPALPTFLPWGGRELLRFDSKTLQSPVGCLDIFDQILKRC